jgi:ATP-binding cassette, subfamily C, bacterial CydC
VPLESLDEPTLRATLAVATQFAWARGATLADNLRLAAPAADEAAMWAVLTAVGLADSVARWPEGLDTWVQEGGHSLSGGQLRRLGVARALLRQAPLTILDEPTEGLDEAAATALAAAVSRHCAGRTLIWISHRREGRSLFGRTLDLGQPRAIFAKMQQPTSTDSGHQAW